jgi:HK97 family phage portal protein
MFELFKSPAFRRAALSLPDTPSSETKSAQPLIALQLGQGAHWTPQTFSALCREGYARNPIVYRCVRLISEAAASVPMSVSGDAPIDMSALKASLSNILETFYGFLQLSGEAYLELRPMGQNHAVYALRPDQVTPRHNRQGAVIAWDIEESGPTGESRKRRLQKDIAGGRSSLFHMKLFSPASVVSPLQACAQAVDLYNEGGRWAKALLENSARPSGALIYKGVNGADHLTDDQFERLKRELETGHAGAARAGRPLVLEGGLDWKSMSLSPMDMDFIQARREAAREIALAFGVPPMLLGLPGDNTYANYREANQAFWRQTVLPLVQKTAAGLEAWLRPWLDETLQVSPDAEKVPALAEDRSALWQRVSQAAFLTDSEKRAMIGLEEATLDIQGDTE